MDKNRRVWIEVIVVVSFVLCVIALFVIGRKIDIAWSIAGTDGVWGYKGYPRYYEGDCGNPFGYITPGIALLFVIPMTVVIYAVFQDFKALKV